MASRTRKTKKKEQKKQKRQASRSPSSEGLSDISDNAFYKLGKEVGFGKLQQEQEQNVSQPLSDEGELSRMSDGQFEKLEKEVLSKIALARVLPPTPRLLIINLRKKEKKFR